MRKIKLGCLAALLSFATGCSTLHPKPGEIPGEMFVFTANPYLALVDPGVLHSREIHDLDGNDVGLKISKEHFLGFQLGIQRLYVPRGAKNVGWAVKRELLGFKVYAGFDNASGERENLEYEITENGFGAKLVK